MGAPAMAGFDADADDFASPSSSAPPAPRARADGGVYQVGGVPVEFPYKPYGTQLAFMGRVIATLDRARRQGQSHALLESPTGTGKSLSLLCSALAWQRHYPLRSPPAAPTAAPDPFLHGGGFVADDTQPQATPVIPEKPAKKKNTPTIYYATRTHAQITQVVREYRKTSYRVRMAILASRKHYCVNKLACMSENIDEQCKLLLDEKVQGGSCPEFKNAQKLSRHPSLQIGGCYEVHDIEDLVRVGRKVKGCPYFAAQHMAEAAQLVFCPYNYLISPIVRRAMDIDIGGSIIILDEAHNIEDTARDAGSVDVDEESLYLLQGELQSLVTDEAVAMIYQPLHDVIQGLMGWISEREDNLQNHEFGHPASYWAGEKAMKELQLAGITPMNFPVLQECATKAVKAASDTESDGSHLSGGRAMTLESLFSSLSYFFANNGRNSCDYQLALQRFVKKEGKDEISSKCTLSLWCLNPAVVFREIADLTLSVILTSGTLSPMGSFASELGVQFEACLEAPHVINVDSQVFAAVLSSGPTRHKLNASYKTADCSSFQDELGTSLEEICRIVPGGALVFFPSYKLLDKLQVRWSQTGQWARLNAQKHVFVEPKGSTEELEPVLKGYYDAILGKAPVKKGRGGARQIAKNRLSRNSSQESAKAGAALLAVCRGKVSEGIDFSDDNARVVVIVGIPFPNINDVQVKLKKRYNDSYKSSKYLLSGSEWYCHQAFRALNQAAGRCIRHKSDYGGIILIDERYQEDRNLVYISKWLRNAIKQYNSFQDTMDGLQKFFQNAEEKIKIKDRDMFPKIKLESEALSSLSDKRKLPWPELSSSNHSAPQKNQKAKTECLSQKVTNIDGVAIDQKKVGMCYKSPEVSKISSRSLIKKEISPTPNSPPMANQLPACKVESDFEGVADTGANYEVKTEIISFEKDDFEPRYKITILNPLEGRSQQPTPVEETSLETPVASPSNYSEINISAGINNGTLSCLSTLAATPERTTNRDCHESLINRSVNSHCEKKRRLSSPMSFCAYSERSNSPGKSQLGTDNAVTIEHGDLNRNAELFCKNMSMSRCENVKLERNYSAQEVSEKMPSGKKLLVSCIRCKTALGLEQDGLLVTCSRSSSSKFYLAYLLRHGLSTVGLPEDGFSASTPAEIQVVECDASSLNQNIFGKFSRQGSCHHSGVWSAKDGCVYKAVICPFCSSENACATILGVQVLATDKPNQQLVGKVLLFGERLDVKPEPSKGQASRTRRDGSNSISSPPVIDLESLAYKPLKKDPVPLNSRRSKLRLPTTNKSTTGT
ncbi:hypothetical protein SETIT_2G300600v2 [Setaria italica]|uniref:DNA 5'-3' helicase FANCJ n=1 Tax=Setaria italica TaxID=4555 RepID=A0A368Q494_SETIT|nr:Fanconi anemia group J protein homolog isoform X2 [Setaria italica]RCV12847.1 hypothetical protein SETIT_2G300600v2 [Setaria italica]